MKFSANLGFLWSDLPLCDAIRAAHAAGFDAVECHWPYDTPAAQVKSALSDTGLNMLGLNTSRGDASLGEFGLTAVPGRQAEARAAVDQALEYGAAIGAKNVHVMAGIASGPRAQEAFVDTLRYATEQARGAGITVLIEPINTFDVPGYFLTTTAQARKVLEEVAADNLKLMFDCYHVHRMDGGAEGNLLNLLRASLPMIGHIQFAAVPDRGAPDHGDLDYREVFRLIRDLGYDAPLGAEYRSPVATERSLAWLSWAQAL